MKAELRKAQALTTLSLTTPASESASPQYSPSSQNIVTDIKSLSYQLNERLLCLTFDDGPDPRYTPRILDVLREYKIQATFFILGEAANNYPHLVERIVDAGHAIGNHSYSHCHPWTISAPRARWEVSQASALIREITGQAPRWFRPPHGRLRKAMLDQAYVENMTTVLWSRSIIDWGLLATDSGIARRMRNLAVGDVVLMHDGKQQYNHPEIIARQLPGLIEWLEQKNIMPVTLAQVLV